MVLAEEDGQRRRLAAVAERRSSVWRRRFRNSFSLSQTGMAVTKDRKPRGANAR